jgi:hypothetical protein
VVESDLRAATAADTELSENVFRRAKASEGGLKEIDSHESGEPKPVWANIMSEREAGEDHGAGEGADGVFEFHDMRVVEFKSLAGAASGAFGSNTQAGQPCRLICMPASKAASAAMRIKKRFVVMAVGRLSG